MKAILLLSIILLSACETELPESVDLSGIYTGNPKLIYANGDCSQWTLDLTMFVELLVEQDGPTITIRSDDVGVLVGVATNNSFTVEGSKEEEGITYSSTLQFSNISDFSAEGIREFSSTSDITECAVKHSGTFTRVQ